ncbi:MAG: phosphoenolpyruvate carboxykinase [Pseudomonadota bacterium]|nr:phosphoenolpyruvate carboxykinase [Pseudomonadota bacterium]
MIETGRRNADHGAETFGFSGLAGLHWNLGAPQLYEIAVRNNEAKVAANGPLVADTGVHTGRSPKDKYIVRDAVTADQIWWDNNNAMTPEQFETLRQDFLAHAKGRTLFAQDLYGGADHALRVRARVYTELAWHSLFIRNLLIRPEVEDIAAFAPDLTIVDLPSFQADPVRHGTRAGAVIACDFTRGVVLIGGTSYAGEIKKSVFTYLNYLLPGKHVMPMHCSANTTHAGETAIFFGLSGTGKTTLSADPDRTLIGDDEHGWSRNGVFNFEGGCYAKAIKLSQEAEPEIYATTERFGTVMENVTLDPDTREPDFDDSSRTENTRIAYPLDFIANASATGRAHHPKNIVMLTCDAFGVLPPIAKLDPAQAMYHFLSGYTAKVAGTEKGVTEPQATFSTCFGAPFLPLHPTVYGNLLREFMERHHVDCWLVNTGWTGGKFGVGRRMPIRVTRRLLAAALDGSLQKADFRTDPHFGLAVPREVPGVEPHILDPVRTWRKKQEFAETAGRLVQMFRDNFRKFEDDADEAVRSAGPNPRIALA